MTKFIYTISVEVEASSQDEATYLIYSTPLDLLDADCLEIEIAEDENFSDDFPLSLEYDEGEY